MKLAFLILYCYTALQPPTYQDELHAVEATYDGHYGGVFYFVDIEGSSYAFQDIEQSAYEKYDLTDGTCEGTKFMVVYRMEYPVPEDKDEDGEDYYGECIIVDLEIIG
jgi:hypothetical protein